MSFEVVSLGLLSKFYQNLRFSSPAKKEIARHFGLNEPKILQSWIRSLTYVRNTCAHHSRLWNRTLTTTPKVLRRATELWIRQPVQDPDKMYYFMCCLWFMLRRVNPGSNMVSKMKDLFTKYPDIDSASMGFPANWDDEPFWA